MVNIESVRSIADKVFSGLVFLMSVVFFAVSFSLPEKSALLPRLVAMFTAILVLPVMIRIWRKTKTVSEEQVTVPVYLSMAVLLGYYLVIMFLGYIVGTLALIIVSGRMVGQKNWIVLIVLAIILTGSTYFLFGGFFGVLLPTGNLFDILL